MGHAGGNLESQILGAPRFRHVPGNGQHVRYAADVHNRGEEPMRPDTAVLMAKRFFESFDAAVPLQSGNEFGVIARASPQAQLEAGAADEFLAGEARYGGYRVVGGNEYTVAQPADGSRLRSAEKDRPELLLG